MCVNLQMILSSKYDETLTRLTRNWEVRRSKLWRITDYVQVYYAFLHLPHANFRFLGLS